MSFARIAVVGAGAWGTALANCAARAGREVTLWARDPAAVRPALIATIGLTRLMRRARRAKRRGLLNDSR